MSASKAKEREILSPKGSMIGTPSASPPKNNNDDDEVMTEAPEPVVNRLEETLRVKLLDTFSGNRKDLEVFLL